MLAHLNDTTVPLPDALQFAYRANRQVDDAVNIGVTYTLQHLDSPGTRVMILFMDFSVVVNTILPDILCSNITQLTVSAPIRQ